ncbi:MAG: winged helix-turn-helix domain-containing protein [Candidatus Bathyarchaeota archaeon]|nr:winged helix-turn-helix domain-containing protein [Candidatus Bathyarchaeota archaeon]
MDSGLELLHKALKDEKRRKILSLLKEGSLSYTELMNELQISNTGKLNYHLKALGDRVAKNGDGRYILTDKGKYAANLLCEIKEKKSQAQAEAPFPRGYLIVASLFSVAVVAVDFGLFLWGQIAAAELAGYLLTAALGFAFLVAAEKVRLKRAMLPAKRQMLGAAVSIVAAGAFAGAVALFFGGGLLIGALGQAGVRSVFPSFNSWIIFSFTLGALVGAAVGYVLYRKSRYSKPAYYNLFEA